MRIFQNTFRLILTLILFNSCSSFLLPELKVTNCTFHDNYFLVEFSAPPDQTSINKALTLTKDDYKEDYEIKTQDKLLYIYPSDQIEENRNYHLIISTEAEDTNGNSLSSNFEWNFSTKLSLTRPEILSTDIQPTSVTFNFNTRIKRKSFASSFSISPSVKYHTYFQNDDTTVSVLFEEPLKNNERYFLSLSTDLENIFNNKLIKKYSDSFINNQALELTTYKLLYKSTNSSTELSPAFINDNLLFNSTFTLQFSNQIDASNINSCIKIIPPIDFSITKNTETFSEIEIKLNEKPNPETEYTLSISDNITDTNQNKLPSSTYKLIFNNPSEIQPVFLKAVIEQISTIIDSDTNYQNIYFDAVTYPTAKVGPDTYADITFLFAVSPAAQKIDYFSAIENIKISSTLNCIEIIPTELTVYSSSEIPAEYSNLYSDLTPNISAVKFHCRIKNHENSGLINFTINQNLSDNLQNKLNSPITLTLNKR